MTTLYLAWFLFSKALQPRKGRTSHGNRIPLDGDWSARQEGDLSVRKDVRLLVF